MLHGAHLSCDLPPSSVPSLPCRCSFILVSKRWLRVLFTAPELWRSVKACFYYRTYNIGAEAAGDPAPERRLRLAQQQALVLRVAPLVQRFVWAKPADVFGHYKPGMMPRAPSDPVAEASLARCLAAVQPAQLAHLELPSYFASGAAASGTLQQLTGVTSLALYDFRQEVAAPVLGALGGGLRSLQLCEGLLTGTVLNSTVQLTQLTELHLQSSSTWPTLGCLTRLIRLKRLVLLAPRGDQRHSIQPPLPSSFPAGLGHFNFTSYDDVLQASVLGCWLGRLCARVVC